MTKILHYLSCACECSATDAGFWTEGSHLEWEQSEVANNLFQTDLREKIIELCNSLISPEYVRDICVHANIAMAASRKLQGW